MAVAAALAFVHVLPHLLSTVGTEDLELSGTPVLVARHAGPGHVLIAGIVKNGYQLPPGVAGYQVPVTIGCLIVADEGLGAIVVHEHLIVAAITAAIDINGILRADGDVGGHATSQAGGKAVA